MNGRDHRCWMMTVSLWRYESECAAEATGVEDPCNASAVHQVWGRGNSGPLRHQLRVFGGHSMVGERMSYGLDFQVESAPVNSQSSRSWLARYGGGSSKRPDTSSVAGEVRRDKEREAERA